MKIALIIPKLYGGEEKSFFNPAIPNFPHKGTAYIAAILKKNKISVKVIDAHLSDFNEIVKLLKDFNPDIIGVTSISYHYKEIYKMIDFIKVKGKWKIVIGGPHVSSFGKEVLNKCKADFAIIGEGEYAMLDLALKKGYRNIPNLIWRKEKNIIENKRAYIENIDSLPFPAYELFEIKKYKCYRDHTMNIITSRGCPYSCTYCSIHSSMGKRFRARSPENVINEIEFLYNRGFNKFLIDDDCFSFDLERAKKICDLIIKKKLKISWQCTSGLRVDKIDKELICKMKASGCNLIVFGIESGSQKVLNTIKKGFTIKQIYNAVNLVKNAGIKVGGHFLVGSPSETYKDFLLSVKLCRDLKLDYASFNNFVPYPWTESYIWVKENGKFLSPKKDYLTYSSYWDKNPIFVTKEFTKKERIKAINKGRKIHLSLFTKRSYGKISGFIIYLLIYYTPFFKILDRFPKINQILYLINLGIKKKNI